MEKTDGLPTEEGKKTDAAHPTAGIGLCWTTPLSCYTCNEYREDEQRIEDESREEQEELVDRAGPLLEGIPGYLMDRHGNSIRCVVKLNKMRTALLLLSGDKGRTVPLQEIRSIFYGDELKRLDAFEADNTACVAVYLVSGSALPIVFPSEDQKFQFLDGVESLHFAFTSQGTAPAGESAAKSYAAR